MGGGLAMIKTQREQEIVAKLLGRDSAYVYIGLTDEGHEGDWRRVDGTPATYTHWAKGEPNQVGGIEHWVAVTPSEGSTWSGVALGHFRVGGFVCQWEEGKPARPHWRAPPPPALRPEDYLPGLVAEFSTTPLSGSALPAASIRTSTSSGACPCLILPFTRTILPFAGAAT